MMVKFGGYVSDMESVRSQLPLVVDPDEMTICRMVAMVAQNAGALGMRLDPSPDLGPYELTLYAESGNFLVMLNETLQDGDENVRMFNNNSKKNDLISILGEKYPLRAVINDFQTVCLIFTEFWRTGDVPRAFLC